MSDKRAGGHLHVEISPESRTGWERFARTHGVTMAAIAEAVGLMLGADRGPGDQSVDELLAIARSVAAERRSRRP